MTNIRAGSYVLNLARDSDDLKHATIYPVVDVVEGEHWSGPQTWVKLITEKGSLVGYDPERFLLVEPYPVLPGADPAAGALSDLLLARADVLSLRNGLDARGVFANVYAGADQALKRIDDAICKLAPRSKARLDPDRLDLLKELKQRGAVDRDEDPEAFERLRVLAYGDLARHGSSKGKSHNQLVVGRLGDAVLNHIAQFAKELTT